MDNLKIFAQNLEAAAQQQIDKMANSPIGENAHIRIMPDAHAGVGCVIGTTMILHDKVCPNLVGVDIGCGVNLIKTNIDFAPRLDELDHVIRKNIPFGMNSHKIPRDDFPFTDLHCWQKLNRKTQDLARRARGTLGGGNHFIEAYHDGYLAVHSGSRNIGYKIAEYYQEIAIDVCDYPVRELCFLTGTPLQEYLDDMALMCAFAEKNRETMLRVISEKMAAEIGEMIVSTHNYIDVKKMTLRKGAISAQTGERLVIPLNMRDGMLICTGLGNEDWNFSAPHGAGRLYSRTQAKKIFQLDDYKATMAGIYSSCINRETLDEAPFAYKDWQEISELITPTVTIEKRLQPIFNFKATE